MNGVVLIEFACPRGQLLDSIRDEDNQHSRQLPILVATFKETGETRESTFQLTVLVHQAVTKRLIAVFQFFAKVAHCTPNHIYAVNRNPAPPAAPGFD